MSRIDVEILSRETIKPSSLTPDHLKTLDLSFHNVMSSPEYTGGLIFYSENDGGDMVQTSRKLKKSLSEALTPFYPFAGRCAGKIIDCNDEGAVFIDAKVDFPLSHVLTDPHSPSLLQFLPDGRPKAGMWPLLLVQASFFSCGGFVLGICLSRRVADASSLFLFLRGWSAVAMGRADEVAPTFMAAKVFPSPTGQQTLELPESDEDDPGKPRFVTKRFVFDASKIKELKNNAASEGVKDPTRFEAITTLLWRCATKATRSNTGVLKPSMLRLPLDIRRRKMSPLLSENSIGNIISLINMEVDDPEMDLRRMVGKLRQEKKEAGEKLHTMEPMKIAIDFAEMTGEFFYKKITGAADGYSCTSWSRSGFYEVDLGFGNPVWVTPDSFNLEKNVFVLLDTKDGFGTEAWVSLTEKDMSVFEEDEELLQFVTPNPSVLV